MPGDIDASVTGSHSVLLGADSTNGVHRSENLD